MEAITIFGPKFGYVLSIRHQTNVFSACKHCGFPRMSFPGKHTHHVPLKVITNTLASDHNRNFKELVPSEWGHQFLYAHFDFTEIDALGREIEELKPEVHDMLMSSKGIKEKVLLIYLLVSLGLAYHYEDAISEILKDGFQKIDDTTTVEDDLYTVSAIFYVFRTYGYNISSDVFRRFKEDNGEFRKSLAVYAKGILTLYEAANMATTTDYILDEAFSFTMSYLESLSTSGTCKPNLSRLIQNALGLAQQKNMEILVAKEYIQFYEKEEHCHKMLLKFSKLNFRFLQLHYLQELKILSKWYKEQDFESKLPPYYRDRFVEMHLISLAYMEPKHARVRILLCKVYTIQLILDDTCDRYASLPEVEILAKTFERWDIDDDAMDGLPGYLKNVVEFIYGTFQELEREVGSELGGPYSLKANIEEFKRLVRSNLQLAKMVRASDLPSFDEYVRRCCSS